MTGSVQLARLIGPTLIVLGLSEMINSQIWKDITVPVIYQSGTLLFVAGLSIILAHNRWKRDWTILITVAGWVALAGGLLRMFMPHQPQPVVEIPVIVLVVQIIVLLVGAALTFKGYRRGNL